MPPGIRSPGYCRSNARGGRFSVAPSRQWRPPCSNSLGRPAMPPTFVPFELEELRRSKRCQPATPFHASSRVCWDGRSWGCAHGSNLGAFGLLLFCDGRDARSSARQSRSRLVCLRRRPLAGAGPSDSSGPSRCLWLPGPTLRSCRPSHFHPQGLRPCDAHPLLWLSRIWLHLR